VDLRLGAFQDPLQRLLDRVPWFAFQDDAHVLPRVRALDEEGVMFICPRGRGVGGRDRPAAVRVLLDRVRLRVEVVGAGCCGGFAGGEFGYHQLDVVVGRSPR